MRLLHSILFVAIILTCASCSDDTPTSVLHTPTPLSWETEYPLSSQSVRGLWAGDGVVVAVGANGLILSYNGSAWSVQQSPVSAALNAVWGAAANDIYAVGDNGTLIHFDGAGWSTVTAPVGANHMRAISGTSGTDVYAAGRQATMVHFDGTAWSVLATPTTDDFHSVWANDDGSVFAGTDTVLVWDGFQWTTPPLVEGGGLPSTLAVALWGTSFNDTYASNAGSSDPGVYHFDGSRWELVNDTGTSGPRAIVGASSNDVYAVGEFPGGGATHWDGTAWTDVDVDPNGAGACIDGTDLLVGYGGGSITRYDGVRSVFEPGLAVVSFYDAAAWPSAALVVGERGAILRSDGGAWEVMDSGTHSALRALWGVSPDDAFAVGDDGVILHGNGSAWSAMSSGTTAILRGVWGTSAGDVYAVGADGVIRHSDGAGWSPVATFAAQLTSVWGNGAGDVYAAGSGGEWYHDGGGGWEQIDGPESEQLMDVWGVGDVVVALEPSVNLFNGVGVGPAGRIHIFDGTAWGVAADSLFTRPVAVWGSSPTDVFAAGTEFVFPGTLPFVETGRILHYDGTAWGETGLEVPRRLNAIAGTAGGDIVAAGSAGIILRARR